jgi:predicted ester cyclase
VAPDAQGPHDGQFATGPEGWRQEIELVRSGLPDLRVEVVEMVEEGTAIAVRWRSRGTHSGTLFGIPPTGKRVEIDGLSLFHVRDGKL